MTNKRKVQECRIFAPPLPLLLDMNSVCVIVIISRLTVRNSGAKLASSSHLISTFESGFCGLAPRLNRLDKDAEASLAAALQAEVERRLPGRLLQGDLPPLSLGGTRYVEQP